jgi:hypothetical protein
MKNIIWDVHSTSFIVIVVTIDVEDMNSGVKNHTIFFMVGMITFFTIKSFMF